MRKDNRNVARQKPVMLSGVEFAPVCHAYPVSPLCEDQLLRYLRKPLEIIGKKIISTGCNRDTGIYQTVKSQQWLYRWFPPHGQQPTT